LRLEQKRPLSDLQEWNCALGDKRANRANANVSEFAEFANIDERRRLLCSANSERSFFCHWSIWLRPVFRSPCTKTWPKKMHGDFIRHAFMPPGPRRRPSVCSVIIRSIAARCKHYLRKFLCPRPWRHLNDLLSRLCWPDVPEPFRVLWPDQFSIVSKRDRGIRVPDLQSKFSRIPEVR
jgi:hypothetical protein